MSSKLKSGLLLLAGIGIGVGVSWTYHKNKYEKIMQEEIEEMRVYRNNEKSVDVEYNEVDGNEEDIDSVIEREEESNEYLKEARKIINYNKYSNQEIEEECMTDKAQKPFVITPEDFASIPGFDTDTFYYHNNDVVVNDNQEVVNAEEFFGMTIQEIKEQFGVHEDNAVYIRNHKLECDYEILLDYSDFYE